MVRGIHKSWAPFTLFGALALIIIMVCIILTWLGFRYEVIVPGNKGTISLENWLVVCTAVIVPLVVWSLSSYISVRNQIRQHSITVLLETRISEHFTNRNKVVFDLLRGNRSFQEMSGETFLEAKRDVIYSLNFLEFVAIGIRRGDLDESVFKRAWKGLLKGVNEKFLWVIKEAQEENTALFENLVWLNKRWQREGLFNSFKTWLDNLPSENKPPCDC